MVYVEYWHYVTPVNWQNKSQFDATPYLAEACGDRSVVLLDGRQSLATWIEDAKRFNGVNRPVYDAFRIMKGETFTRSTPITELIKLES